MISEQARNIAATASCRDRRWLRWDLLIDLVLIEFLVLNISYLCADAYYLSATLGRQAARRRPAPRRFSREYRPGFMEYVAASARIR